MVKGCDNCGVLLCGVCAVCKEKSHWVAKEDEIEQGCDTCKYKGFVCLTCRALSNWEKALGEGVTDITGGNTMEDCENCKYKDAVDPIVCPNCLALSNLQKYGEDAVNNPPHYKHFEKEVIDIIKETLTPTQYEGYCMGNEMKYRLRAGYKTEDYKEDMDKAMWYKKERLDGK